MVTGPRVSQRIIIVDPQPSLAWRSTIIIVLGRLTGKKVKLVMELKKFKMDIVVLMETKKPEFGEGHEWTLDEEICISCIPEFQIPSLGQGGDNLRFPYGPGGTSFCEWEDSFGVGEGGVGVMSLTLQVGGLLT